MVICLEQGADCLCIVQLMPLHPKTPSSLASFKSKLRFTLLVPAYPVVLEKKPLNGCSSSSLYGMSAVSSIKDVHTEGKRGCQKSTNVDMGEGVFKLQWTSTNCTINYTNPCDNFLLGKMAQKWAKVTPFHGMINLVLHNNFDIYMFYLLIYFYYVKGLTVRVKNRNRSITVATG